jgi:hypothetical protein
MPHVTCDNYDAHSNANGNIALDVGQLVKDEYFTLFESIGAIEVKSPYLIHDHQAYVRRSWTRKWTAAFYKKERLWRMTTTH